MSKPEQNVSTDKFVVIISIMLMAILVISAAIYPTQTGATLVELKNDVVQIFGAYYILVTIAMLVFCSWLCVSKYGAITMGREKPEYSDFSWLAMIFCATMGGAMLYWAILEWTYYVRWPPYGFKPLSPESFNYAMSWSYMHWGFMVWGISTVGVIPLAYRYYNRQKNDLALTSLCEVVMGEKWARGLIGKSLNVLMIMAVLIGLIATYATGIPMLSNALAYLFGLPDNMDTYLWLFLIITTTYSLSTFLGLKKGMRRLSQMGTYSMVAILAYVLILGSPLFIIENSVQSIGILLNDYLMMITYMDPSRSNNFPQDWSCFYWAWWLVVGPWMWVFFAKISRGRSVRAIVLAITVGGSVGTAFFFSILGGYSMELYLSGAFDVIAKLEMVGEYQTLTELLATLPWGTFVLILWLFVVFFLLTTTMDSAAFTLATTSSVNLKSTNDPGKFLRLFWAIMLTVAPVAILYMGKAMGLGTPIEVMKALLILGSLPISLIGIMAMYAGFKWLAEDYGTKTREEIIKDFQRTV